MTAEQPDTIMCRLTPSHPVVKMTRVGGTSGSKGSIGIFLCMGAYYYRIVLGGIVEMNMYGYASNSAALTAARNAVHGMVSGVSN